jgi:hypothetical protein
LISDLFLEEGPKNMTSKKTLGLGALALLAAIAFLNLAKTKSPPSTAGMDRVNPESSGPTGRTAALREAYGKLPLAFEQNRGQADEGKQFQARGTGYTLSLSPTEASFLLSQGPDEALPTVLRMHLLGADPAAAVEGLNELAGKVNYLLGNDPAQWRTNIPTFSRVRYREVYPGIDLVYYGNQRRLEYDFVVAPGRTASAIALEFAGTERMAVEAATGDLLLGIGKKTIRQHKPIVYQETSAGRREVEGRYALRGDGRVGFEVGQYDASATLVIDPVLEYSTYLGGNSSEEGYSIAVDTAGSAYVTGWTQSTNFPGPDPNAGVLDVFVTKINAAGSALVYSTYIGGSDSDAGLGLAIDSAGNAYITGYTSSTDFPTVKPIQGVSGFVNDQNAFVTKLNPAGTALVYSTYLGGSSADIGYNIAVDSAGNAYIVGGTISSNFPTVNAIDNTLGGEGDAFVTKINAAGTALVYSTYLGGDAGDTGRGLAIDSPGNAYITGSTTSTNFPLANAFQSTYGGAGNFSFVGDAFVTKINPAGTALVYSTYLGGNGDDEGSAIALDSAGNAYIAGSTASTNFPLANAFQSTYGGDGEFEFGDVFVTKINPAGTALVYSTYLGGAGSDYGRAIAVGSSGEAYITGSVTSTNFPIANPIQATNHGGAEGFFFDAFVAKFNATGTALIYSTYLGGGSSDYGEDIALDSAGNAYVIGDTRSTCFPTTVGAFDTTFNGGDNDGFVLKISETAPPSDVISCPSQLLNIGTRARVLTGDSALIGGFTITGDDPKRVIIRGIGPSTNLPGALANPTLQLFDSSQALLGSNDNWTSNAVEVQATGIPPNHNLEAAIVARLGPGAYTAVLRGHDNTTGIGLIEIYDLNPAEHALLVNLSSRGFVDTGDNVIIGGFIIGGGSAPARALVRAIGPSLTSFFPNALANPTLELRNADGSLVRSNDNWRDSQETEIQATGLAPTNSLESAIIASLGNGNYTAILRGKDNTTGVAVVEIYNVP